MTAVVEPQAPIAAPPLPECPYPGIEPFSYAYRELFFSREQEKRDLVRDIVLRRGNLLYSASGIGKSSLINAGLIPAAILEGYVPERLRVQPVGGGEFVLERIPDSAAPDAAMLPSNLAGDSRERRIVLSADELVARARAATEHSRPLLIFDQFEEWITLFPETKDAELLRDRIRLAISWMINEKKLPVKVLLTFREDYLAALAPLFADCPNLPDQYLRLAPMSAADTFQTIRGPFTKFPGHYGDRIPEPLSQTIMEEFVERIDQDRIRLTEVQIVCRRLFEESGVAVEAGQPARTAAQVLDDAQGVSGVLRSYFDSAFGRIDAALRPASVALMGCLVTSSGTRAVVPEDTLVKQLGGQFEPDALRRALTALDMSTQLVTRESRRGESYYEISSEFLVDWIRGEQVKQQLKDQELALRRHDRMLVRRALVVLLAAAGVFWLGSKLAGKVQLISRRRADSMADALVSRATNQRRETGALFAVLAYQKASNGTGRQMPSVMQLLREAGTESFYGREYAQDVLPLRHGARWAIAGSHASPQLASAGTEVLVWNTDSVNKAPQSLSDARASEGISVAMSDDGTQIAVGSFSRWVRRWRYDADRVSMDSIEVGDTTYMLAFSHDGRMLAAAHGFEVTVHGPHGGKVLQPIAVSTYVTSLAFDAQHRYLFVGDGSDRVAVWRIRDQQLVDTLEGSSIAVSERGGWLATGGAGGRVRLWHVDSLRRRPREFVSGGKAPVLALAMHPDGRRFAWGAADSTIREVVLDADGDSAQAVIGRDSSDIFSVAYVGRASIASLSGDGRIRLRRQPGSVSRLPLTRIAVSKSLARVAIGADGDVVAALYAGTSKQSARGRRAVMSAGGGTRLQFWRITDGRVADSIPSVAATAVAGVTGTPFFVFADSAGRVTLTDPQKGISDTIGSYPGAVRQLTASDSGTWFAMAGEGHRVQVIAFPERRVSWIDAGLEAVTALAVDPSGRLLALGRADGRVRVYSLASRQRIREFRPHSDSVTVLAFSRDGGLLVSAGSDGLLHLWDETRSRAVFTWRGTGAIRAAGFRGDDQYLYGAGADSTLRVWRTRRPMDAPQTIRSGGEVLGGGYDWSGDYLFAGTSAGWIERWPLNGDSLVRAICRRVGRNLQYSEWLAAPAGDEPYELACPGNPLHPSLRDAGLAAAEAGQPRLARQILERVVELGDQSFGTSMLDSIEWRRLVGISGNAVRMARDGHGDSAVARWHLLTDAMGSRRDKAALLQRPIEQALEAGSRNLIARRRWHDAMSTMEHLRGIAPGWNDEFVWQALCWRAGTAMSADDQVRGACEAARRRWPEATVLQAAYALLLAASRRYEDARHGLDSVRVRLLRMPENSREPSVGRVDSLIRDVRARSRADARRQE